MINSNITSCYAVLVPKKRSLKELEQAFYDFYLKIDSGERNNIILYIEDDKPFAPYSLLVVCAEVRARTKLSKTFLQRMNKMGLI